MKLMKWLLKISLTAVLVSTLTILTTGLVVSAYLQSVLASFNIQLDTQAMGVGGVMKNFFGMNGSSQDSITPDSSGVISNDSPSKEGTDNSSKDGNSEGNNGATDPVTEKEDGNPTAEDDIPPDNSLPVMGEITDEQIVMTPDEMVDKKSSLTTQQKEDIFTLLMNKLPQEEMQKISEAMEDGLTVAELDEIQNGISKYLSKEEFENLMTMLQQ